MTRFVSLLAIGLALSASAGCSKKDKDEHKGPELGASGRSEATPPKGKVVVSLSVDWEGAYFSKGSLDRIRSFRDDFKDAPLTHYICPAYFTQGEDAELVAQQIKPHLREGDELGLHIHAWFSLAKAAGIEPHDAPRFYAGDDSLIEFPSGDKGYEVSLAAYSSEELLKLVTSSKRLLEENGIEPITSFRAGGYMATHEVLEAVRAADIEVDSSSTWPTWFSADRERPLDEDGEATQVTDAKMLTELWPHLSEHTQPYGISTKAGPIIEVPNTGAFPEVVSSDEMLGHLQRALAQSAKRGEPTYVNFGFHQETAGHYLDTVADALYNFQSENPGVLEFATVSAVAKAAVQ